MKRKRWHTPKAKSGELKAQWGKMDRWNNPDLCFAWGENCHKSDGSVLHHHFSRKSERFELGNWVPGPSLLEELEQRGYDLTTLKFSIKKKGL